MLCACSAARPHAVSDQVGCLGEGSPPWARGHVVAQELVLEKRQRWASAGPHGGTGLRPSREVVPPWTWGYMTIREPAWEVRQSWAGVRPRDGTEPCPGWEEVPPWAWSHVVIRKPIRELRRIQAGVGPRGVTRPRLDWGAGHVAIQEHASEGWQSLESTHGSWPDLQAGFKLIHSGTLILGYWHEGSGGRVTGGGRWGRAHARSPTHAHRRQLLGLRC
jgi:hypothetical protein